MPDIVTRLEDFARRFTEVYHEKASPRIIRCIIKISDGDMDLLERYIKSALSDWRDIILWAEYDKEGKKVFSGNRRFT